MHSLTLAACNGVGVVQVFTNRGYKHGRVMIITTSLMFVAMTTGVVIGIGVLDEPWPAEPGVCVCACVYVYVC